MSLAFSIIVQSRCRECTLPRVLVSYQRQDQAVGMPYSRLGPPLLSFQRKGKMNSHGRQLHLPSSPLQSQSTQQLQQIRKGRALWKSVREDEGSRKEWRGWFPHAEQEKKHTPAQHELSAEARNKGNNQLFPKLLTF